MAVIETDRSDVEAPATGTAVANPGPRPAPGANPLSRPDPGWADRRRHPRYPAAEDRAHLAWGAEWGHEGSPARLVDISRGGAQLVVAGPRPPASAIRIRLEEPEGLPWVEASVVAVETIPGGVYRVRVAFRGPCPDPVFRAATGGRGADGAGPGPAVAPDDRDPIDERIDRFIWADRRRKWADGLGRALAEGTGGGAGAMPALAELIGSRIEQLELEVLRARQEARRWEHRLRRAERIGAAGLLAVVATAARAAIALLWS